MKGAVDGGLGDSAKSGSSSTCRARHGGRGRRRHDLRVCDRLGGGSSYVTGSVVHVDGGTGVGSRAGHEIIDEDIRYDWVTGRCR